MNPLISSNRISAKNWELTDSNIYNATVYGTYAL